MKKKKNLIPIDHNEILFLSAEGQANLMKLLQNPSKPTETMKALHRLPDLPEHPPQPLKKK